MSRPIALVVLCLGVLGVICTGASAAEPAPADAYVILIEDSFIYINWGRDRGVQVGDLFSVWRPGKAIVDPVSGDTLGSEPVSIAKLRVQYVSPHYSKTYALEVVGGVPLQVRDRVARWTGERVGWVPAPVVVGLEAAPAPAGGSTGGGERIFSAKNDKIFKDRGAITGDVVGDFELDGEILDYDFGDVDGDGVPDLVVLEERKVTVYNISAGRPDQQWSQSIKGFVYVVLELFDGDGDGRSEIYVGFKQGN